MARRNRFFRRMLSAALGSAVVIGVVAGGFRAFSHPQRHAINTDPATIAVPSPARPTEPAVVTPEKPLVHVTPSPLPKPANKAVPAVLFDTPTTRPAVSLSTTRPSRAIAKSGPADAPAVLADADAKTSADDLVAARDGLNTALATKTFKPADEAAAKDKLGRLNDTVVFGPRKFLSDPGQVAYQVVAGDNLQKIANRYDVTVGFLQRVNNISDPRKLRLGQSLKIVKGPFHAVVNKTAFTLDVYQGQPNTSGAVFLKRLRVGLGENDSTPTGLWKIGTKLIDPTYYNSRNEGPRVIASGDAKNPLGGRWLALEGVDGQAVGKESYGIHGTIDPDSIGQKKSMGCIRLLDEDIKLVYDMLVKDKSTVLVVE